MATVILDFLPPEDKDIVSLLVQEADTGEGPFTNLASHPAGVYPDYISKVTITDASSAENWFRIAWLNSSGGTTPWSEAVPGNTTTYLSKLVDRVMLRMPDGDENIIAQESEAVIEEVLRVDPYASADANVKYKTWNGMALLVMARVQLTAYAAQASTSESFTAGLVSMRSDSANKIDLKSIRDLIDEAGRLLGFSSARVVQMIVPPIACGFSEIVMADISRLQIDVA
jgi:hypothetical protein